MRHFGVFTCKGDNELLKSFLCKCGYGLQKKLVFNPQDGGLRPPEIGFGMLYVPPGGLVVSHFWRVFSHQKYLWCTVFLFFSHGGQCFAPTSVGAGRGVLTSGSTSVKRKDIFMWD